jgi:hypothetical protein
MAIKLSELENRLADLSYPVSRGTAVDSLRGETLQLADGEVDLGETLAHSTDDEYESVDDLSNEIHALLPREAVGEPYQSEGEG